MNKLKITVLNDNRPGRKLLAEHGLSYFIEFDEKKILLDTGASDVFLKNAEALNIDLDVVDQIVLSHGHWDHGDGLQHIRNKKLLTHPNAFLKRYHKARSNSYVGLKLNIDQVREQFDLQLSEKPVYLSNSIIYVSEIPRENDFEAKTTAFEDAGGKDDFILDDSALVFKHPEGLVVISGCAHAGICNTVDYAMQLTNERKVLAVVGGFHLKKADSITHKTIAYFKEKSVKYVIPSHCTELPALSLFAQNFRFKQVCTGDVITF